MSTHADCDAARPARDRQPIRMLSPRAGHPASATRAPGVDTRSASAWAFLAACTVVVVWAVTGPVFGFSDAWQLVINTGTTIVTFLMVFLIQNTQNRDAARRCT